MNDTTPSGKDDEERDGDEQSNASLINIQGGLQCGVIAFAAVKSSSYQTRTVSSKGNWQAT
jgi:hypothetical protein